MDNTEIMFAAVILVYSVFDVVRMILDLLVSSYRRINHTWSQSHTLLSAAVENQTAISSAADNSLEADRIHINAATADSSWASDDDSDSDYKDNDSNSDTEDETDLPFEAPCGRKLRKRHNGGCSDPSAGSTHV
ncbi:MAG: hypothetical protein Q9222_007470 [Ikaeria aurantiellina]